MVQAQEGGEAIAADKGGLEAALGGSQKSDQAFDGHQYQGYRVSVRLVREPYEGRKPIEIMSAEDAYEFLKPLEELDRESFWRLDLNHRNQLIGCEEVSRGHMSGSLVHPREVYKGAILTSAAAIVVAHNHPSGDPMPSDEDENVTTRLHEAGGLLGIPLLDHVIIGNGCYWSIPSGKGGSEWIG